MREAIGGTWLFGLVITFIVFFASFLAISINYSKAFNVKNNVLDLISKYEGNNCSSRREIKNYLTDIGYLVPGDCGADYIPYDNNGEKVFLGNKGYFCIKKVDSDDIDDDLIVRKTYYEAKIFFKFDLPVIGDLTTFNIKGESEAIYFAKHDEVDISCYD